MNVKLYCIPFYRQHKYQGDKKTIGQDLWGQALKIKAIYKMLTNHHYWREVQFEETYCTCALIATVNTDIEAGHQISIDSLP
jgi:hypothetical protein